MILTIGNLMLKPEDIEFLIIHCSDTPDNKNIGASYIHKMHLNFGWHGIGKSFKNPSFLLQTI